ncbi:hypothetical protein V5O48_018505, partial [Marasmius crinis-equi]
MAQEQKKYSSRLLRKVTKLTKRHSHKRGKKSKPVAQGESAEQGMDTIEESGQEMQEDRHVQDTESIQGSEIEHGSGNGLFRGAMSIAYEEPTPGDSEPPVFTTPTDNVVWPAGQHHGSDLEDDKASVTDALEEEVHGSDSDSASSAESDMGDSETEPWMQGLTMEDILEEEFEIEAWNQDRQ